MAYITRQRIKGQDYYYLVENIQMEATRRQQVRRYVGNQLPTAEESRKLIRVFESEMAAERKRILGHSYIPDSDVREIDRITDRFWKKYTELNPTEKEQFDEQFMTAFVFNTNSIEGSTLTPKEVELLLTEDISPNKSFEDAMQAKAVQRALEHIKNYSGELTEELVLAVHEICFRETKSHIAGKYKSKNNSIRASQFEPTPVQYVLTDMKNFFSEYNEKKKELHPLELAAWVHWRIVRIHPFQDGNGRTARLLMNFILKKNNYPMIDIKTKEKNTYFRALERCHKQNNAQILALRLVRRFKKQYQNALK